MEKITSYLIQSTVNTSEVRAWEEDILLPTYEIGKEEKNPIFLEKRVYQGSSGSVYPYPVVEKISDEKKDKLYHALFIENEYIKVMILPELGGRIHMAYDKVKQRHFVYYNQVVKPALVGCPQTSPSRSMPTAARQYGATKWNACSAPKACKALRSIRARHTSKST